MMTGPAKPFDPFGTKTTQPNSNIKSYGSKTHDSSGQSIVSPVPASSPLDQNSKSIESNTPSIQTSALSVSSISTAQHISHNTSSIFELGGEPLSDQHSGASSSRLSRIVGASSNGPLSSATSPIGLRPLVSIGSSHTLFGDAYQPSQGTATPNSANGIKPAIPQTSSKRLSQSRFSGMLNDQASLMSGVGPITDKSTFNSTIGTRTSILDPKPGAFDNIQSQQSSPKVTGQSTLNDFSFVKSLPVSRRNSREFQNLWQELEGFTINDSAPHPVDIATSMAGHLAGFDGHSIAAQNSSGAFRQMSDAMPLGASPKLPHGLLDEDMLAIRSTGAGNDSMAKSGLARGSFPSGTVPITNGSAIKPPSMNSIDLAASGIYSNSAQPGAHAIGNNSASINGSTGGEHTSAESALAAIRTGHQVYGHDSFIGSANNDISGVISALDSMGSRKSTANADILLGGDSTRDMRLYDPSRNANLIRNASTPVLNTKQYQVMQATDELMPYPGHAHSTTPHGMGYPESGKMSAYDMNALAYNSQFQGPQINASDIGMVAGGRGQPGSMNYPYMVGTPAMLGHAQQYAAAAVSSNASGAATPLSNGYSLHSSLGPASMAYGGGPHILQPNTTHVSIQHSNASIMHGTPQQIQQQVHSTQPQAQPSQQQQAQPLQQQLSQPQQQQPVQQTQAPVQSLQQQQQQQHHQGHGAHHHAKHQHGKTHRKGDGEANRFANTTLEELKNNIFAVCKDQHGCRYLQKKLEDGQESHVNMIFEEVSPHFAVLMTDPFGNYLCQKLLEHCTEPQRTHIVTSVSPELVNISLNMHGTRAVQKMIEYLSNQDQVDAIIRALRNSVVLLIRDLNGNHVVQKCLNRLMSKDNQFIYNSVADNCIEVATHRHGCCVFQRCIDFASDEQKLQLVKEVISNALALVQDPFGNYVVQYVLDLHNTEYSEPLIMKFVDHICGLSVQKFSSNVMEKCIRLANSNTRRQLISPLLQREKLDTLMRDSYGNYVVQTALDYADPQQRLEIIDVIRPLLPAIRHTPYGKRIYTKLQRDGYVSAVPSTAGSRHASPTLGPSLASHSAAAIATLPMYTSAGSGVSSVGLPPSAHMAQVNGPNLARGVSPTASTPGIQPRMYGPPGSGSTTFSHVGIPPHQAQAHQQQPASMYSYKAAQPDSSRGSVQQAYQIRPSVTPNDSISKPVAGGQVYEKPSLSSAGSVAPATKAQVSSNKAY